MSKHDHDHDHGHDHHDHSHSHELSPEAPFDPSYFQLMETVVRELLIEKGVLQANDVRKAVDLMDSRTGSERAAKVVARAWTDPDFKALLLSDGQAACEQMGYGVGDSKMPAELKIVENTPTTHNVIVCTLCSCYPRFLMGIPPDWYKSRSYRSRVISEPREVLKEFGTHIAEDIQIVVHDSTADLRFLVLPMQPAGTEGLSADALAALVTRDALIGVTTVKKE
jgi:nitrile hydratase